jgi:hypothetical protein
MRVTRWPGSARRTTRRDRRDPPLGGGRRRGPAAPAPPALPACPRRSRASAARRGGVAFHSRSGREALVLAVVRTRAASRRLRGSSRNRSSRTCPHRRARARTGFRRGRMWTGVFSADGPSPRWTPGRAIPPAGVFTVGDALEPYPRNDGAAIETVRDVRRRLAGEVARPVHCAASRDDPAARSSIGEEGRSP